MRRILIPVACLAALTTVAVSPAIAITCDGNFQVLRNGDQIATPYCEDNNLAVVANRHGMRVSPRDIRYHPSVKEEACKLVGDDIRVRDTCLPYRGGGQNLDTSAGAP